jgi:hypothetical protein
MFTDISDDVMLHLQGEVVFDNIAEDLTLHLSTA